MKTLSLILLLASVAWGQIPHTSTARLTAGQSICAWDGKEVYFSFSPDLPSRYVLECVAGALDYLPHRSVFVMPLVTPEPPAQWCWLSQAGVQWCFGPVDHPEPVDVQAIKIIDKTKFFYCGNDHTSHCDHGEHDPGYLGCPINDRTIRLYIECGITFTCEKGSGRILLTDVDGGHHCIKFGGK